MNKNIKNIIKEKIITTNINKKDLVWNIKKSIQQNNNITTIIKTYLNYSLSKTEGKNKKKTQKHKICLMTGKRSGILKGFCYSRYVIKKLLLSNKLANIKTKNW